MAYTRNGPRHGRLVAMTLEEELDQIFAARDRDNMQPTIDALLRILDSHPRNARALYEVGGAYDTGGHGETARSFYEEALAEGLDGDLLRRCYVQYGSTLRNLGEYERSREVFRAAREAFPDSPSLGVFEALTLQAAGEPNASVASLLDVIVAHVETPDIDRYKAAITANATAIRGQTTPLSR